MPTHWRDTQTRARPDTRTDSASGGRRPGLPRGGGSDERPGSGQRALHPTAQSGGRRPGGERGVRAPPPRELGGPAPPPPRPPAGLSVGSPGLRASAPSRAAPRGLPNFQRCPAPRPRRRRGVSIVGPGRVRARGSRGPWRSAARACAPAAGALAPPPPAVPSLSPAPSPALRSAPCPAALSSSRLGP